MTYKSQTLSAVVIARNDGAILERALSSLHWVDELIVFDCGSTDNTLAVARAFTDKVYFHPSLNPAVVRRDALASASSDWLLLLEPNEWIEEMLRHEIDGVLLSAPGHIHGYTIPRRLQFRSRWISFPLAGEPVHALRLVRRGRWVVGDDRDAPLSVTGEAGRLDRPMGCAPFRNMDDLFAAVNGHSTLDAYRHLERSGVSGWDRSLFNILLQTKLTAWKYSVLRGGLLNATDFMLAMANTLAVFLKYAKIRALTESRHFS